MKELELYKECNSLHAKLEEAKASILKFIFKNMKVIDIDKKHYKLLRASSRIEFCDHRQYNVLTMCIVDKEHDDYGIDIGFSIAPILKTIERDGKVYYNDIINYNLSTY
jgi:hypothetical protein